LSPKRSMRPPGGINATTTWRRVCASTIGD
jgi:hypothetical protein